MPTLDPSAVNALIGGITSIAGAVVNHTIRERQLINQTDWNRSLADVKRAETEFMAGLQNVAVDDLDSYYMSFKQGLDERIKTNFRNSDQYEIFSRSYYEPTAGVFDLTFQQARMQRRVEDAQASVDEMRTMALRASSVDEAMNMMTASYSKFQEYGLMNEMEVQKAIFEFGIDYQKKSIIETYGQSYEEAQNFQNQLFSYDDALSGAIEDPAIANKILQDLWFFGAMTSEERVQLASDVYDQAQKNETQRQRMFDANEELLSKDLEDHVYRKTLTFEMLNEAKPYLSYPRYSQFRRALTELMEDPDSLGILANSADYESLLGELIQMAENGSDISEMNNFVKNAWAQGYTSPNTGKEVMLSSEMKNDLLDEARKRANVSMIDDFSAYIGYDDEDATPQERIVHNSVMQDIRRITNTYFDEETGKMHWILTDKDGRTLRGEEAIQFVASLYNARRIDAGLGIELKNYIEQSSPEVGNEWFLNDQIRDPMAFDRELNNRASFGNNFNSPFHKSIESIASGQPKAIIQLAFSGVDVGSLDPQTADMVGRVRASVLALRNAGETAVVPEMQKLLMIGTEIPYQYDYNREGADVYKASDIQALQRSVNGVNVSFEVINDGSVVDTETGLPMYQIEYTRRPTGGAPVQETFFIRYNYSRSRVPSYGSSNREGVYFDIYRNGNWMPMTSATMREIAGFDRSTITLPTQPTQPTQTYPTPSGRPGRGTPTQYPPGYRGRPNPQRNRGGVN